MRRVVVTGMGLVSPFGMGVEHSWKELLTGRSARQPRHRIRGRGSCLQDRRTSFRAVTAATARSIPKPCSSRRNCARSATSSFTGSRPPTKR